MATPNVFVYRSDQPGAAVLNNAPGALAALLNACLVAGFGSVTFTGVVRVGTVATGTTAAAHTFVVGDPILVAGAAQADYNGSSLVTAVTSTTLSWTVANSPVTPATGTITCKVAPAGWTRPFVSGNIAAFKPAVGSSGIYMRVDDSATTGGDVGLATYETMTAISTGTLRYSGRVWRAVTDSATAVKWVVVASNNFVHMFTEYSPGLGLFVPVIAHGDFVSFKVGDAYNVLCAAGASTAVSNHPWASGAPILCRSYTQTGSYVGSAIGAAPASFAATSSPVDAGNYFYPVLVNEGTTAPRCMFPGLYRPMFAITTGLADGPSGPWTKLAGVVTPSGTREFMCFSNGDNYGVAVDITGPW